MHPNARPKKSCKAMTFQGRSANIGYPFSMLEVQPERTPSFDSPTTPLLRQFDISEWKLLGIVFARHQNVFTGDFGDDFGDIPVLRLVTFPSYQQIALDPLAIASTNIFRTFGKLVLDTLHGLHDLFLVGYGTGLFDGHEKNIGGYIPGFTVLLNRIAKFLHIAFNKFLTGWILVLQLPKKCHPSHDVFVIR